MSLLKKMNKLYRKVNDGVVLNVKIIPRALRNEIVGILEKELKVKIKSPPVKGAANKEIIEFFSQILGIPKRDIEIIKGITSSHKSILFRGNEKEIIDRLNLVIEKRRD